MTSFIDMRGVAKRYHLGEATVAALTDVTLTIQRGEFTALSGPSGSGKSTLLNICGLLDAADSGSYRLEDEEVMQLTAAARTRRRRQHIGFVFQNFNLVPVMTAYENIEYPLLLIDVAAAERRRRVARSSSRPASRISRATCRTGSPAGNASAWRSRARW